MNIDITPTRDGAYCVTAHLEGGGPAHDFFATKQEAVEFATSFYGGAVEEVKPEAPKAVIYEAHSYTRSGKSLFDGFTWAFEGGGVSHGPFKNRAQAEANIQQTLAKMTQKVGA